MRPPISRREFLIRGMKVGACVACSSGAFSPFSQKVAMAQTLQGSGKILVFINFMGGIDGLNWVVPYNNQIYYDRRPTLAIPPESVLPLNSEVGLHPLWRGLYDTVFLEKEVAVIQQVAYPEDNQSHFISQDIWSFGRRNFMGNSDQRGWIGRLADLYFDSYYDVIGMGVSNRKDFLTGRPNVSPLLLQRAGLGYEWDSWSTVETEAEGIGRTLAVESNMFGSTDVDGIKGMLQRENRKIPQVGAKLDEVSRLYEKRPVPYPDNTLGHNLQEIAKLIQGNLGTQVFYTGLDGWDTHANQQAAFEGNLTHSGSAVQAFISDMKLIGQWDKVCLVFFSEFGRNCFENQSDVPGTDHGYGNTMMLMGKGVQGGVYGPTPSANDLSAAQLGYYIDFRSVFKNVVRNHLGLNPDPVFDEPIPIPELPLPLFA